jgi:hypothetical protein
MPEREAREVEHFLCCSDCRGYFDIRDLAQVIEHAGRLPHPAQD